MRGLNPTDIPPTGRYDMVVVKIGHTPDGPLAHATIDGGEFDRKRVSGYVPLGVRVGHRFNALLGVTWIDRLTGDEVAPDFREGNVQVRYSLDEFQRCADGRTSVGITNPKSRFSRT